MNLTITTTSTTLRRGLRHAALALCALVGLVAASCTADPFDGTDHNPDGTISFAVAPRPAFTEVTATRATQTPGATHWQTGDILWLEARFFQDRQNTATVDTFCISALKYDGAGWRYLTEAEAQDLNTRNIPDFSRLLRWPRRSADWADPGMSIAAYYAGSGKPDADGILTTTPEGEIPATPVIEGATDGIYSPDGKSVLLEFMYHNSRVHIPAGCKVELTDTKYWLGIKFEPTGGIGIGIITSITEIPAQSEGTDVFLRLESTSTATFTRDGVSCSFAFTPLTDAQGNPTYSGASYTLTPYTNGTQTPVAGYDLTVANETELRELARAVNAGEKLPNGKPAAEARVLQTANIELTKEWVPIGNSYANAFRGAYNGNGHTITGLTITTEPPVLANEAPAPGSSAYTGLFSYVRDAVLTGIHLQEVQINIRMDSESFDLYVGPIVGAISNSTLSLCSASGTVNTESSGAVQHVYVGGIAGGIKESTISRCWAAVATTATTMHVEGTVAAGGIIGRQAGLGIILSCEVRGTVVTAEGGKSTGAGGIAGLSGSSCLIAFCRADENAVTTRSTGEFSYAGGLVASNIGRLYSCYSSSTATATGGVENYAGAIVGKNSDRADVQHCYGAGATGKGTSDLNASPDNIIYTLNPTEGNIYALMSGYGDAVKFITDGRTNWYLYTTSYNPGATPAHGIEPLRVQWTSAAWKDGTTTRYPEINMEYEGE